VFPSSLELLTERYGVAVPDLRDAIAAQLEHLGKSKRLAAMA
jgi:hypothetical protein